MFRKRHVQIGPVALTMARKDALSFYGKDRHVHGYWVGCVAAQMCRRPGVLDPDEERSLRWLEFYHRSTSIATLHNANSAVNGTAAPEHAAATNAAA